MSEMKRFRKSEVRLVFRIFAAWRVDRSSTSFVEKILADFFYFYFFYFNFCLFMLLFNFR